MSDPLTLSLPRDNNLLDEIMETEYMIFSSFGDARWLDIISAEKDTLKIKKYTIWHIDKTNPRIKKLNELSIFKYGIGPQLISNDRYFKMFKNGYILLLELIGSDSSIIHEAKLLSNTNFGVIYDNPVSVIRHHLRTSENLCDKKEKIERIMNIERLLLKTSSIDIIIYNCDINIDRSPENIKDNTFDYINIELSFIGKGSDIQFSEFKETIKTRKKEIDKYVIEKLRNNTSFLRFNIPINFLKVDKIFVTKNFDVIYTLSLKEVK